MIDFIYILIGLLVYSIAWISIIFLRKWGCKICITSRNSSEEIPLPSHLDKQNIAYGMKGIMIGDTMIVRSCEELEAIEALEAIEKLKDEEKKINEN